MGEKILSVAEQLAFTTTRIECQEISGDRSVGTGFFFDCSPEPEKVLPVLVTNRHVVENARSVSFRIAQRSEDGRPQLGKTIEFEVEGTDGWIGHPDETVDLSVLGVGRLFNQMALKGRRFIWRQFGSDTLASDEEMASLFALQPILTVGYPIGISDTANNMPVFRQGVAATHPSLDFEGRKEFLIDAACYPGCSGSPVVLYEPGLNIEGDDHIKVTGPRGRLMLLGVVYGGFEDSVEGKVKVVPVPTRLETVVESRVPIHLGAVIKAERLLDFGPLLAETILRRNGK